MLPLRQGGNEKEMKDDDKKIKDMTVDELYQLLDEINNLPYTKPKLWVIK